MAKTKLTEQEATALLIVMRSELQTIFEDLELKVKDYDKAKKAILDNLSYIIKKGLKADPESKDIYDLFK